MYLREIYPGDLPFISNLIEKNLIKFNEDCQRTGYLFHNDFKGLRQGDVFEQVHSDVVLIADETLSGKPLGFIYLDHPNTMNPDLHSTAFYLEACSKTPLIMSWERIGLFRYIKQIVVDEPWRGRNIGTDALRLLTETLSGCTLFSAVETGNEASERAHLKSGFAECGSLYVSGHLTGYSTDLLFRIYTNNQSKLSDLVKGRGRWALNKVNGTLGCTHSFGSDGFRTVYINRLRHDCCEPQCELCASVDVMVLLDNGNWVNAFGAFMAKDLIPDVKFEVFREPLHETERKLGFFYA